jgi:hypothetical protein
MFIAMGRYFFSPQLRRSDMFIFRSYGAGEEIVATWSIKMPLLTELPQRPPSKQFLKPLESHSYAREDEKREQSRLRLCSRLIT